MEERHKIILNGVEVDDDFTGIIEERNGKMVGDMFGKNGRKKDVFKEKTRAEAAREKHANFASDDVDAERAQAAQVAAQDAVPNTAEPPKDVVPITLNNPGDQDTYWSKPENPTITDKIFQVLNELFPD